ncbi:S-adenosyl-L-methionine-dependent methyltransferase [Phycomyces blakesleeanus]|uniref:S-adenosyl-L-methionine-dependent methyltransferase n=1 Tax=Phycomyces blakesleeanus TaxID=4837 RepID=A0ABR3BB66_PHYBL
MHFIQTAEEREHGQHYLLKHVVQANHFAPIENALKIEGSRALDIGCGSSGVWILDMAADFTNTTFYGIDIIDSFIPQGEKHSFAPTNCHFQTQDVIHGIPFPDNTFDYIHQRFMYMVYPSSMTGWGIKEMKRVMKPGATIELIEYDLRPRQPGPLFTKLFSAGNGFRGEILGEILKRGDFNDITTDYWSLPICWGGEVGKTMYISVLGVCVWLGSKVYDQLDLQGDNLEESYDRFLDKAFDECVEYQTYFNLHWAYGTKPTV